MPIDSDLSSFESSSSTGSGGMLVPLLVGFAGLLLSGAALYFSLGGTGKADDAKAELATLTAKAEGLETRLRDLEAKYALADSELKATQKTIEQITKDTRNAFKDVAVEVNRNRDMIENSADKLTELINTLNRDGRSAATVAGSSTLPSTGSSGSGSTTSATSQLPVADVPPSDPTDGPVVVAAEPLTHTIRSGDTFSKLSKQYGVTVAAILAANPDVDPRQLAIGQRIKIPVK